MQNECSSKEICVRCGGAHTTPNCDKPPKCINCNGEHPASNKDCPKRIENIKIITKVAKEKCSYKEARTEVKHEIKKQDIVHRPKTKSPLPKEHKEIEDLLVFIALLLKKLPAIKEENAQFIYITDLVKKVFGFEIQPQNLTKRFTELI
ncbi:Hypothetical predicted protein [Mytilus galloprovincialis]|uniref:Uncharacterized protein n=1 Tax=Mytilus galloprovincialis TaxID=29158 RepID=A0A8B6CPL6_MYTGA|nr:Hypothetical predicted protein [Mytilus galloprovincialis]